MLFSSLATSALFIGSTLAAAAPVTTDSTPGAEAIAVFNKTSVRGSVDFKATSNGSIQVTVDISGLPANGGPFLYHVHQLPVDSAGNCSSTLGHLDPYSGEENAPSEDLYEVGDLSGKHGTINGTSFSTTYLDPYLSLNTNDPAYFGNLSVVFHYHNTTRIACANITVLSDAESSTSATNSSSNSSNSSSTSIAEGAAHMLTTNTALVGLFIGALSLFI